ncbi:MAG: hypothetical protein AAGN82_30750, partial [Myxococcota bacterium]
SEVLPGQGAGGEGGTTSTMTPVTSSSSGGGAAADTLGLDLRVVAGGREIRDAIICVAGTDRCDTTRFDGLARLEVAKDTTAAAFTVEHPELRSTLFPAAIHGRPEVYRLEGLTRTQATFFGIPDDQGAHLGHVVFTSGATVVAAPAPPDGVAYGSVTDGADPAASGLDDTSDGYVLIGMMPGEVTITIEGAEDPCDLSRQWPADAAGSFRAPLEAGYLTVPFPVPCTPGGAQ